MPYLNVDEVESALEAATSAPYDAFTKLIPLPILNLTWEGRRCNAIKIANGDDAGRPGVFFLGGIHADEWGGPDILINFIEQLEQHYLAGTGIILGGKSFSDTDIRTIVDNLDIYVFPQANPDGRNYSQTGPDPAWRKNRRTAAPNSNAGNCVGVDLNRNFDFLWDYKSLMAASAAVAISDNPCSRYYYQGPKAFSEPETRNVKWIHDNFPNIGYFVDLHSAGPTILYSWGDDDDQSVDPSMNFRNAVFDGVRGLRDALAQPGAYLEYIPSGDLASAVKLANTIGDAIYVAGAVPYTVQQGVTPYPTAGTSDDYAYSRNFVDAGKRKVLAFTIECGDQKQPPYVEMQDVIRDVTAGLLAFCLAVRKSVQACALATDRGSFGKDEVDAMLKTSTPARFEAAFHLVVDGFRHEELLVTTATLTGVPDVQPAVTFSPALGGVTARATACSAEGGNLAQGPQRFTWTFAIEFTDSTDFTQEVLPVTMTAALPTTAGVTMSAQAVITLTMQPKPYEIDGQVPWLSVDLQVCQVLENGSLPSTPAVTLDAGPNDFIGRLLAAYNDPTLPRAPGHPFDLDLVANQATSSVEIAGSVGSPATPVHNFALARVRYRAISLPASNVRVFFRVFQAPTTSTEYQPAITYPTGGIGGNRIPLLGVVGGEIVTIPFFAAPRVDPTNPDGLDAQTDPLNVGPLGNAIPTDGSGAEVQVYFGCWLDINQQAAVLPATPATTAGPFAPVRSIQDVIRGQHQCLVAEIQLDPPAPQIPSGATPADSDRLAQRNLSIVGVASPHLVPLTFDIKPTDVLLPPDRSPDELMIQWGNLPAGARATIFLPDVGAKRILEMADRLYRHHELSLLDGHTLTCRAAGISYIPIPPGAGSNYPGLITVEVPAAVREGQTFTVVARQVTRAIAAAPGRAASTRSAIEWRRIIGSFQLSIPVKTAGALLEPERRLLSVLRFIASSIPPSDRWHPVFHRYLGQLAGRVDALGGDSTKVGPSSKGDWGAAARCRNLSAATAILLGALTTTLGVLTGVAIVIVPPVLALSLVIVAAIWIGRCRPGPSRLSRTIIGGLGLAASLLAVLALAGPTSPQLAPVLFISIVLLAATLLIGGVRNWF